MKIKLLFLVSVVMFFAMIAIPLACSEPVRDTPKMWVKATKLKYDEQKGYYETFKTETIEIDTTYLPGDQVRTEYGMYKVLYKVK